MRGDVKLFCSFDVWTLMVGETALICLTVLGCTLQWMSLVDLRNKKYKDCNTGYFWCSSVHNAKQNSQAMRVWWPLKPFTRMVASQNLSDEAPVAAPFSPKTILNLSLIANGNTAIDQFLLHASYAPKF